MNVTEVFKKIFETLKNVNYYWEPQTPDILLQLRKSNSETIHSYSAIMRLFGLGLPVLYEDFQKENCSLNLEIFSLIQKWKLGMSRIKNEFIPFSHWPPDSKNPLDFVYQGHESYQWMKIIESENYIQYFQNKKILDLGCSSGALSFYLHPFANEILGIDLSQKAINWAQASKEAQNIENINFIQGDIGSQLDLPHFKWDIAVFNPPMTIPHLNEIFSHRDGGNYGIEIIFKFLEFAEKNLRKGADVFCLATNPIVHGKSFLFESLFKKNWKIQFKKCLHRQFNHAFYKEKHYKQLAIERIELYFLHLKK